MNRNWYLIWQLFKRDFLGTYKRSILGIVWIFFAPVVTALSWFILSHVGILVIGKPTENSFVFILIGTNLWAFFLGSYNSTNNVLASASTLLLHARFPAVILILKQIMVHFVNYLVVLSVLLIALLFFGVNPAFTWLLFLPSLIPILLLGAALGTFTSVVHVVIPEFKSVMDTGINFSFFLTPVVFAIPHSGILSKIISHNPLTPLFSTSRGLILIQESNSFDLGQYIGATGLSLGAIFFAILIFTRAVPYLIERLT